MNDHIFNIYSRQLAVSTDTRKIQPGDLFFALKGDSFNGNAYAAQALEKGASHVVIDDPAYHQPTDGRYILVDDSLKALQDLARQWRETLSMPVIGLTGSNGKTTTKELIHSVLSTQIRPTLQREISIIISGFH